jgi:carbamoyl-phosphate synthase large subunit
MFNILFTSVGRRVELLRCFRRAYHTLGLDGRIIAIDIDPLAPALREGDRTYLVPRTCEPGFIAAVADICRQERVRLVFPLIDPDIYVLAKHARVIQDAGARAVVVSPAAALITADKWHTAEFFRRIGVPTPQSWLPSGLDGVRRDFPLFIKPRQGSAGKHAFKVCDARELEFFTGYVPDPIIEDYLPGPEITNDVVCDLEGEVLAVVSRQRIETRSGEVAKGITVHDAAITEHCIKIARELPAVGPITVQCIRRDGRPFFTEINARLGGGVPLAIAAGADLPLWLLGRAAGMPVEVPSVGTYRSGLYLTRFDESFFLTEAQREQMARSGF